MGVPTVYKWTDADAPVLTGEPGTFVALLRACLVDGLDVGGPEEKAAAGWEMSMDPNGNQRAAFRSLDAGASLNWLYIDDTGTIGAGGNRWARGWGCLDFAWDGNGDPVLTDQYPPAALRSWGTTWAKSDAEDATSRAWVLIADEKTFYFLAELYTKIDFDITSHNEGTYRNGLMAFGDYRPVLASDPNNCMLAAGDAENYTNFSQGDSFPIFKRQSSTPRDHNFRIATNDDGSVFSVGGHIRHQMEEEWTQDANVDFYSAISGNPILDADISFTDDNAVVRGVLRGARKPVAKLFENSGDSYRALFPNNIGADVIDAGGTRFGLMFDPQGNSGGVVFFDLGDWDA